MIGSLGPGLDLAFHHVGVATKDMERARSALAALGYTVSPVLDVAGQSVRVCFAERADQPLVELIGVAGDSSPIDKRLERVGSGPYHICYSTGDLAASAHALKALGFIRLGPEFLSGPLGEQRTAFFQSSSLGMIELTEHRP